MTRDYPVTSQAVDITRRMERDAQKLPAEQIIREIFAMNPAEHRNHGLRNVSVGDVEKLAATHLRDADGNPVFRRTWADNCSGIPRKEMAYLLQNYGKSSKPSSVFSGNHGEGAILSGGTVNPNGLVFIAKDTEHPMPYVCIWDKEEDEYGLVSFENADAGLGEPKLVPIADADQVLYFETEDGTVFTYKDVWDSAYDNTRFSARPASGVVVVELGQHDEDSTYYRTQRTYDSGRGKGTWNYSRWAVGEYLNAHFRKFPDDISYYWGVPGADFAFNFGESSTKRAYERYAFKPGQTQVSFEGSKNWMYREAVGLDKTVMGTGTVIDPDDEDAADLSGATIVTDTMTYLDGPIPFDAEVIIRTLPGPSQKEAARKLAFNARRKGKVFVDYNDEVFERTEGNPHELFGVSHADALYCVWIAIKPHKLGTADTTQEPGTVWMAPGRTELLFVEDSGASTSLPWYQMAKQFCANMPPALVEWIQAKDDAEPDEDLSEPEVKALFDRFEDETKAPPKPTPSKDKVEVATGDPDPDEIRCKGRNPIVNHPGPHPKSDDPKKRKSPTRRRTPLIRKPHPEGVIGLRDADDVDVPDRDKEQLPPLHTWVDNAEEWPEVHERWAVLWEEPTTANHDRGRVKLNWNHWYVQEVYTKLALDSSRPNAARKLVRNVFAKSVLTKVAHRRKEATKIGLSAPELEQMLSPMAMSGFVMGWWDHHEHLNAGLKKITKAKYDLPDDDEEVA